MMEAESAVMNDAVNLARRLLAQRRTTEADIQDVDGEPDIATEDDDDDDLELQSVPSLLSLDGMQGKGECARENIKGSMAAQPRKVHSLRLSEFRWCAPVHCHTEQRVALLLRGVPWKLCNPTKLREMLHQVGFGEMVKDLQIWPSKPGHPGCAVLKVRATSNDVQRIAKFFHGRQIGTSMPMAVSLASPGATGRRLYRGSCPAKVPSSLRLQGTTSEPRLLAEEHGDADSDEPLRSRHEVVPSLSMSCYKTMDGASAGSTSASDSPRQ